jgi:hypothetical protein
LRAIFSFTRTLQRVHPQVERGRLLQAASEREDLAVRVVLAQAPDHPVGKVGAHFEGKGVEVCRLELREPGLLRAAQDRLERSDAQALQPDERGQCQFARRCRRRHAFEQPAASQHGVHGVGDERAIAAAQGAVVAEMVLQDDVGGASQGKHDGEGVHDRFELGTREGRCHGGVFFRRRSARLDGPRGLFHDEAIPRDGIAKLHREIVVVDAQPDVDDFLRLFSGVPQVQGLGATEG